MILCRNLPYTPKLGGKFCPCAAYTFSFLTTRNSLEYKKLPPEVVLLVFTGREGAEVFAPRVNFSKGVEK